MKQSKKYEISFFDGHSEIMNYEDTSNVVDELEMFERDDVNMIHELEDDGSLGRTIWTEEEGLFVRNF